MRTPPTYTELALTAMGWGSLAIGALALLASVPDLASDDAGFEAIWGAAVGLACMLGAPMYFAGAEILRRLREAANRDQESRRDAQPALPREVERPALPATPPPRQTPWRFR